MTGFPGFVTCVVALLSLACGSEAPATPKTLAPAADLRAVLGTWHVRYARATILSDGLTCYIDPRYPNTGCLKDTNEIVVVDGSISVSGVRDSSYNPNGTVATLDGTIDALASDLSNAPPKPRCSGQPVSCWTGVLDTEPVSGFGIAEQRSADTVLVSISATIKWGGLGVAPGFVSSDRPLKVGPPYTRGYDSTRNAVLEITRR